MGAASAIVIYLIIQPQVKDILGFLKGGATDSRHACKSKGV
jgi:hypothetical protein